MKQTGRLRKQTAFLLAQNTQMNARSTEIRKQLGKLRKQTAFLLAEKTQMRKQSGKLRKQTAFLLNAITVTFKAKGSRCWFDTTFDSQASNYTELQLKQQAMAKGAVQSLPYCCHC